MRYMILIHSNDVSDRAWASGELAELEEVHAAVISELRASGEFVDTHELDVEDAVVIGNHNGAPIVTRGPFTEGTEWVGGLRRRRRRPGASCRDRSSIRRKKVFADRGEANRALLPDRLTGLTETSDLMLLAQLLRIPEGEVHASLQQPSTEG